MEESGPSLLGRSVCNVVEVGSRAWVFRCVKLRKPSTAICVRNIAVRHPLIHDRGDLRDCQPAMLPWSAAATPFEVTPAAADRAVTRQAPRT